MGKNYNIIDDGFQPELVARAFFDGVFEIPHIDAPNEIVIPKSLTPFSKRKYVDTKDTAICAYEHDFRFSSLVYESESTFEEIKEFSAFITPDCSLYLDMPLCLQIVNTYFNCRIILWSNG